MHKGEYILSRNGIDFIPADISLSMTEIKMINTISREYILKGILKPLRRNHDYILIDCQPSLQILPINALAAADSIIIPVQAHYFGAKGLELLPQLIAGV